MVNNSTGFNIIDGTYSSSGSTYTIQDGTDQIQGSFYDNFNTTAELLM